MQELAKRSRSKTFVDHGPSGRRARAGRQLPGAYKGLYDKAKHIVVKPGDKLPVPASTGDRQRRRRGAEETAAGRAASRIRRARASRRRTSRPIPRTRSRSAASSPSGSSAPSTRRSAVEQGARSDVPEQSDRHDRSVLVSHHGTDLGSPQLVHGLAPRVAVMQNGTRKGAGTQAMPTMRTSPGLEDIWQLHWGYGAGIEQNSAGVFIANVDETRRSQRADCAPPGRWAVRRPGAGPGGGGPGAVVRARAARAGGPGAGGAGAGSVGRRRRGGTGCGRSRRGSIGCWCADGRPPGCR